MPIPNNPILDAWQRTVASCPDRAAVLDAAGNVLRTFADIESESCGLISKMEELPPRSVLAIRIPNHPSWPAVLLAGWKLNHVVMPVDATAERSSLDGIYADCGAAAEVCLADGTPALKMLSASPTTPLNNSVCLLKLTSGTTASPRAIKFRAVQLLADCESVCVSMGISKSDINLASIPFSHSYGFSNLVTPLLCRAVPLAICEDLIPAAMRRSINASGARVLPGTPVHFRSLAASQSLTSLAPLRLCISAGAPLDARTATPFFQKFDLKIHSFYGSSECGGICYDGSESPIPEPGFVGTPMLNVQIQPNDEANPHATTIQITSPAVGDGYLDETPDDPLKDGHFKPADIIKFSSHGLTIVGRESDIINVGGKKLNPATVESALACIPAVSEAAVFGVTSDSRTESVIACIVCPEEISTSEILTLLAQNLSPWQMPRDIWRVNSIPRNSRGKISRRDLAALYHQSHQ